MTSKQQLQIAPGFALPLDAVTETFAFIGTRGGGKTYGCKVMVEEMLRRGLHVCILDPMHAWWGLRLMADSKAPGYDIAILGGERGDVPLEPTGGALVADLIVGERLSSILDVSLMSKTQRRQFVVDFAERLYQINRQPLHLVVEEADMFVPQNARGEERMEGAFEDLVRRGRGRGIGISLLSQRPQVVNKNVLELTENFVAMRAVGTRSREAVKEWFDAHATPEELKAVMASLPSLQTGEGWFYSAHFLGVMERIRFREARTFDSSATPKAGERQRQPKKLSEIDLPALREAMASTIEKKKADDPRELRRQLAAMEKDRDAFKLEMQRAILRAQEAEKVQPAIGPSIPILNDDAVEKLLSVLDEIQAAVIGPTAEMREALRKMQLLMADYEDRPRPKLVPQIPDSVREAMEMAPIKTAPIREAVAAKVRETMAEAEDDLRLSGAEKKFLQVLAQFPGGRSKAQLAILSGYSIKSSTIKNTIGSLRSRGYATPGEPIRITPEGEKAFEVQVGAVDPLPAGEDLLRHWEGQLRGAEAKFLRLIVDARRDGRLLDRETLADLSGYSTTSSTIKNALGRLRTLQLINGFEPADELL